MESEQIVEAVPELIQKMKFNELAIEIALASSNIDETNQFLDTISSLKVYDNVYSEFLMPLHLKVLFDKG